MEGLQQTVNSFLDSFSIQLQEFGPKDAIDILIVAVLFYYIIRFFSDRRAGRLAVGVIVLLLVEGAAVLFNLVALKFIMEHVFQVGVLALIIIFQPEMRSLLESMGGDSLRSLKSIRRDSNSAAAEKMIGALCQTASDLSLKKTGALIVIERDSKLGDIIASGTVINADVEPYLLENIFFNKAPLHDGAVIIRDGRIWAAGCLLPLSQNHDIIKDLGTRHRAAIGMSENTDAVVIVVSEETGNISLALGGRLKREYDYASLKSELMTLLVEPSAKKKSGKTSSGNDYAENS